MKSKNYNNKRLTLNFFISIIILNILCISKLIAAEPQYGAYPKIVKPINIEIKALKVLSTYNSFDGVISPLSKKLMIKALNIMYLETNNKAFSDYKNKFENLETNEIKEDLTSDQLKQVALFNSLADMQLNNKITLSKEFKKTIIENFRESHDDYHKTDYLKAVLKEASLNSISDKITASFFIFNTAWGINQKVGMMWLDSFRVPTFRAFIGLLGKNTNQKNYTSNNSLTDAAFIAAASQMYRLTVDMSQPMPFVSTPQYSKDIIIQKQLLAAMPMPDKNSTIALMRKTAEAQLKNTFKGSAGDAKDADRSWYRGSFFTGIMSAWRATGDDWYLKQAEALAAKTKCEPGPNAMHDANDLNISQIYLELYEAGKEGEYRPTQLILDSLIKNYNPKKVEWSWCDALFMAPPTWARMGKITGDKKYFEHMDKLWWQTSDLIFDKEASLFHRDLTYTVQEDGFQIKERNAKKIYWGRGNGWVMGALPRVLEYIPADFATRPKYEAMFKAMCKKLLSIQGKDGLWRSSLLDTKSYPMGETSSTTFYCYAFAWGINHGLLDSKTYKPAAFKAWKALSALVNQETGRLEYVQLPADSPRSPVYKNCNVEYATGAYLLGGAEILKLMNNIK